MQFYIFVYKIVFNIILKENHILYIFIISYLNVDQYNPGKRLY